MSREPSGIRLDYRYVGDEEKEVEDADETADQDSKAEPNNAEERQYSPEPTLIQQRHNDVVNAPTSTLTHSSERLNLDASVFAQTLQIDDDEDHVNYENPNDASAPSIIKERTANSVYPPAGLEAPSYKDQVRSGTRTTGSQSNTSSNHKQHDDADLSNYHSPPIVDAHLPHAVVVSNGACPCNRKYMICLAVSIVLVLILTALVVGLTVGLLLPNDSSESAPADDKPPTLAPTTMLAPTSATTTGSGDTQVLVNGGDTDGETAKLDYAVGMYNKVANPLPDDPINSSDQVIEYVRDGNSQFDSFGYLFSIPNPNDILNGVQVFVMDLYTTRSVQPGTTITIQLEDSTTALADNYPVGRHSACTTTTTDSNNVQWETMRLDSCSSLDAQVQTVDTVALFFDEGNLSNGTYYFDNLRLLVQDT